MSSTTSSSSSPGGGKKRSQQPPSSTNSGISRINSGSSSSSSSSKRTKTISNSSNNVRVVARLRPLSSKEVNEASKEAITAVHDPTNTTTTNNTATIRVDTSMATGGRSNSSSSNRGTDAPKTFEYDGAFAPAASQQALYEHTVGDMVRTNTFKGFNTTIMAYGQTGSGKTFTMGTEGGAIAEAGTAPAVIPKDTPLQPPSPSDGIIPRAVYDLFDQRQQLPQGEERVTVEMSYLEIYNEEAIDLLASNTGVTLVIRDGGRDGVNVQNLTVQVVTRPEEVSALMNQAATKRATASTAMNAVSSRSHAICTLTVTIAPLSTTAAAAAASTEESTNDNDNAEEGTDNTNNNTEIRAKLTLVDLAGSERIKRTGAEGKRMKEGININKGLFVLGQCVSALSELGQQGKSAATAGTHIPFRNSKLTRLLQDSLGGNSKTVMVACISPADSNVEESVNTLRYASRTRNIQNSAVRNVAASTGLSATEAAALRKQNATLQLHLTQAQAKVQELLQQQVAVKTDVKASVPAPSKNANSTTATNKKTSKALSIVTSNLEQQQHQQQSTAATTALLLLDISTAASPRATVEGMDVSKLDEMKRLQCTISSLESKLQTMQDQQGSTAEDVLLASIRADKWQLKYEQLSVAATTKGLDLLPPTEEEDSSKENCTSTGDLASQLRHEIASLKAELQEAFTDAAMARATAAAVLAGNGDLTSAANALSSNDDADDNVTNDHKVPMTPNSDSSESETDDDDKDDEKEEQLALTAELVAVSGDLEAKEAQAAQANQERDLMDNMRKHFEAAVQSLQDEVIDLESERDKLLKKTQSKKVSHTAEDAKRMKERVADLEDRLKLVRKKAAEHKKSLRLREAAEKKCTKLAADIAADKKRRVTLQKQLKEQQSERRSEKLKAKTMATKMLRDRDKLKLELQKVKDAAEKQAVVLRRKTTEALNRQKLQTKRRLQQEERRNTSANNKSNKNEQIGDDRNAQLQDWLDREIDSASTLAEMKTKIKQQKRLLEKVKTAKKETEVPADESASFDEEIEMRTSVIDNLEQNVKTLFKNSWTSPTAKAMADSSSFMDASLYIGLSEIETKALFSSCFHRLLSLRKECDSAESSRETSTSCAVNTALTRERRAHEETLVQLKMEHSQAIMDLLNSTKGSIEHSVRLNSLNSVVDSNFQATVESMLTGYLNSCDKASESVKFQLDDVKQTQEGMQQAQDGMQRMMTGMIGPSATTDATTPPPKKKKIKTKKKKRTSGGARDSILDEIELLEAEEGDDENDNSEDSDWSPSKHRTPGRIANKRSRKSQDSSTKDINLTATKKVGFTSMDRTLNDTMETSMEDISMDISMSLVDSSFQAAPARSKNNSSEEAPADEAAEVDYQVMKVKELRAILRTHNLSKTGVKAELIVRLQEFDRSQGSGSSNVVDLTGENSVEESSKENAAETNRRTSNRATRGRGLGLQNRNTNNTDNIELPGTPTQRKKGGWSTKKIASVRRSTIFSSKKRSASPSASSPDLFADSKPRNLGDLLAGNNDNLMM